MRAGGSRRARRWLQHGLVLFGCLLLAALLYLWLMLFSPLGYERPDHLPPVPPGEHRVFVYGTLRLPPVRWLVLGDSPPSRDAVLPGYRRQGLDLVPDPASRVEGELLEVEDEELRRLDRYERLGLRYQRTEERLADGSSAWVYQRIRLDEQ